MTRLGTIRRRLLVPALALLALSAAAPYLDAALLLASLAALAAALYMLVARYRRDALVDERPAVPIERRTLRRAAKR